MITVLYRGAESGMFLGHIQQLLAGADSFFNQDIFFQF